MKLVAEEIIVELKIDAQLVEVKYDEVKFKLNMYDENDSLSIIIE